MKALILELAALSFSINSANGFWPDATRSTHQVRGLISSESTESLEAIRSGKQLSNYSSDILQFMLDLIHAKETSPEAFKDWFKENVKDSFECEIADVAIRSLDLIGGIANGRVSTVPMIELEELSYYAENAYKALKVTVPSYVLRGVEPDLRFIRINYLQAIALGYLKLSSYDSLTGIETRQYQVVELDIMETGLYSVGMCFLIAELYGFDLEKIVRLTLYNNSLRGVKHGDRLF